MVSRGKSLVQNSKHKFRRIDTIDLRTVFSRTRVYGPKALCRDGKLTAEMISPQKGRNLQDGCPRLRGRRSLFAFIASVFTFIASALIVSSSRRLMPLANCTFIFVIAVLSIGILVHQKVRFSHPKQQLLPVVLS